MLFVQPSVTAHPSSSKPKELRNAELSAEDAVDREIEAKDGAIRRARNPKMCLHAANGMCDYCMPLEPYDAAYMAQQKIKHMSFHAFLRKCNLEGRSTTARFGSFVHALEEPNYAVTRRCPAHAADAICTKCQPSAIVLQQQPFRMVDHVEFETPALVERFIAYWRRTGYQRFGLLMGRYAPYDEVPLGIKAVVCAIYEPTQDCSVDGFELIAEDPHRAALSALSAHFGLQPVGLIFTDLQPHPDQEGKVLCKRSIDSYFVTGFEMLFSARMQLEHPSACKHSSSGVFGSKFVSVVVSGDAAGDITLFPYQVSNSCTAMVRADIVEATLDPAHLSVCTPANGDAYVPEVFYRFKNEYGASVQKAADPAFPVDYLLVSLTHGFPSQPNALFTTVRHFPPFNRLELDERPSLAALYRFFFVADKKEDGDSAAVCGLAVRHFCNFDLLMFLYDAKLFPEPDLKLLADACQSKNEALLESFVTSESWLSVVMLAEEEQERNAMSASAASASGGEALSDESSFGWNCTHCTFYNSGRNVSGNCEMCGLPK